MKSYLRDGRTTKDTNRYLVLKIFSPTGWMDDQGYRWVPGLRNFTKSYLWNGQTTKDTNGYQFLEILPSPTYEVDG